MSDKLKRQIVSDYDLNFLKRLGLEEGTIVQIVWFSKEPMF